MAEQAQMTFATKTMVRRESAKVAHITSNHTDSDGVQRTVCGLRIEGDPPFEQVLGGFRICLSCIRMREACT